MNADAVSGGMHEVLRIAQYGNDRNLEAGDETHQHLIALGVLPGTIRHNCQLTVASVNLRDQQQFGNEPRRAIDIDIGWQNRNQDTAGIVGDIEQFVSTDTSRQIDDQVVSLGLALYIHGTGRLHHLLVCRDSIDLRSVAVPFFQPAHAEPLRIAVHQCRCRTTHRVIRSDIRRERRLAGTTFGIENNNPVQIVSVSCYQHRSTGVSPSPLANN